MAYLAVLFDDLADVTSQIRAHESRKLTWVVQGIAAPEPRLLRQLSKGEEALRPPRVPQATARCTDRQPVHGGTHDSPPEARREPAVPAGQDAGKVLAIAAEQLVGAHPGQHDLHAALAGGLTHEQRVDSGRITDRLVEHVDDPGQHVHDVRRDLNLVQRDAVALRYLPG